MAYLLTRVSLGVGNLDIIPVVIPVQRSILFARSTISQRNATQLFTRLAQQIAALSYQVQYFWPPPCPP